MDNTYQVPISSDYELNKKYLDTFLGIGLSFDAGNREIFVSGRRVCFYYINGLVNTEIIIEILKKLMNLSVENLTIEIIDQNITHQQVSITEYKEEIAKKVTNGMLGFIVEGETKGFIVDVRSYPGRNPEEPDTERVVRGSRDGFVENIVLNTALIRRRVRDSKLRNKLIQVGKNTTTDVSITYIEGKANQTTILQIEEQLKTLNIDELSMSDKALEELIIKQGFNPYPKVRYTERPDIVANHLYQGQIAIIVDTSPSVMLLPISFFDHISHAEEYRQTPFIGTFMKSVRFAGILMALFLVPVWYLFVVSPELLPDALKFIGPKEFGNVPIFIQIMIAEVGIEFIRMAAIHTPSSLGTAMGIIAGILVGQMAIDVGLFSPEVVLYVAVSGICSYATPSYELSLANKMSKLFFIVMTALFKIYGLIIAIILWLFYLSRIDVFGKKYLEPFYPFKPKSILREFIRFPKKIKKN